MNPPLVDPWKLSRRTNKAARCALLGASFAVGMATGVGLCVLAVGRDLFDRIPR